MAAAYINDKRVDGNVFGQSSTDKIAFYGATPVVRQAAIADATDAATAITRINLIITALETYGLLAT